MNGFIQEPWKFFVWWGLLVGLLLCFLNPAFGVPDEPMQFYRAWSIASGNVIDHQRGNKSGQWLPANMTLQVKQAFRKPLPSAAALYEPLDREKTKFFDNPQYVLYSPAAYLPQISGILLSKWIGFGVLGQLYLARVLNLLVFVAVTALAISRFDPYGWILAVVALLPMTMHQAASASADGLTLALSFLAAAVFLDPVKRFVSDRKHAAWTLLMVCLLALSKIGYLILGLFSLSHIRSMSVRQRWLTAGILVTGLVAALCWLKLVQPIYVPLGGETTVVSPDAQLAGTVQQPLSFIEKSLGVVYRAFLKGKQGFYQIIGILGWLDIQLPTWIYGVAGALLVLVTFSVSYSTPGSGWTNPSIYQRLLILVTLILGTGIIFLWLYLSYNRVGNDRIEGLQGRYFLPFLAPFLMAVSWPVLRIRYLPLIILAGLLLVWIGTFHTLLHHIPREMYCYCY